MNTPPDRHRGERLLQAILGLALGALLVGGVLYLTHHHLDWPAPRDAGQTSAALHSIPYAFAPASGRFWMELGLALLLWSPALRLGALLLGFVRRRDWSYTLMTLLLLVLIAHSLLA